MNHVAQAETGIVTALTASALGFAPDHHICVATSCVAGDYSNLGDLVCQLAS